MDFPELTDDVKTFFSHNCLEKDTQEKLVREMIKVVWRENEKIAKLIITVAETSRDSTTTALLALMIYFLVGDRQPKDDCQNIKKFK